MGGEGVMEPRDELQALVVQRLRAARGAPVSYDELREMGIENPALLGYELAAAGLPIEHAREPRGGALALAATAQPPSSRESGERAPAETAAPPALRRDSRAGVAAGVGLTTVLAVVLAVVLSSHSTKATRLNAGRPPAHVTSARSADARRVLVHSTPAPARERKRSAPPAVASRTPPMAVAVSPAVAASLEAQGHELLAQGRYAQAIGELRGAIRASGGSVARCAEPDSGACLTFAYALFDLGRALRLDGEPAAAIPILSERLRVNNQLATVQAQLELARASGA